MIMAEDEPALTHLDSSGKADMVDVGDKDETERIAVAEGSVFMAPETLSIIRSGNAKKGDVIATARIAGIMAAKQTSQLIPLCHPLMLTKVSVSIDERTDGAGLRVEAMARLTGRTGVEMEALTAVSVTCLTIYDMAKAVDKGMEIGEIRLLSKSGGRSGEWLRAASGDAEAGQ